MSKRQRRFGEEFGAEAVRLVETSGRTQREIATDLGIGLSTLRRWLDWRRASDLETPPPERQEGLAGAYQAELRQHGIQISMSGKGDCYDNAMVETCFKTLKAELVWRIVFQSRVEASAAIGPYIDGFYKPVRRHSALDLISPLQFERRAAQNLAALHFFGASPVEPKAGAGRAPWNWSACRNNIRRRQPGMPQKRRHSVAE